MLLRFSKLFLSACSAAEEAEVALYSSWQAPLPFSLPPSLPAVSLECASEAQRLMVDLRGGVRGTSSCPMIPA